MEIKNLLTAKSRTELREWLMRNHRTERECWVAVKRGKPKDDGTFWYIDAVEEALCFGWIDSTVKKNGRRDNRAETLAPKSPGQLDGTEQRTVPTAGTARADDRSGQSGLARHVGKRIRVDEDILRELQSDPVLWENYQRLPELYKRVRIDRIQYLKEARPALFRSRLDKFIENTRKGTLYGEWNDHGRLTTAEP